MITKEQQARVSEAAEIMNDFLKDRPRERAWAVELWDLMICEGQESGEWEHETDLFIQEIETRKQELESR